MSEHDTMLLRQTLDQVDRLQRRWVITFGITAALSQAAWIALVIGAPQASEKTLILLATLALAMCIFGGVFLLVLHSLRMTQKVLRAIELSSRRAPTS